MDDMHKKITLLSKCPRDSNINSSRRKIPAKWAEMSPLSKLLLQVLSIEFKLAALNNSIDFLGISQRFVVISNTVCSFSGKSSQLYKI
mmetsp:Transcript_22465/g.31441  ORF Transcript_22465/g.31441 Transcript_22465/m.31441 type:complete len:88 (+) Transcript_22465:918-1181(+)